MPPPPDPPFSSHGQSEIDRYVLDCANAPHGLNISRASRTNSADEQTILPVVITVTRYSTTPGFLHLPSSWQTPSIFNEYSPHTPVNDNIGVVFLSGISGGVLGPSGMWPDIASEIAEKHNIPSLRLDYRHPATGNESAAVTDLEAGLKYLAQYYGIYHTVLVGWSFGAGVCYRFGHSKFVKGIASVASVQALEDIAMFRPRPVYMIHGKTDDILPVSLGRQMEDAYWGDARTVDGRKRGPGQCELWTPDGNGHEIWRNRETAAENIVRFIVTVRSDLRTKGT